MIVYRTKDNEPVGCFGWCEICQAEEVHLISVGKTIKVCQRCGNDVYIVKYDEDLEDWDIQNKNNEVTDDMLGFEPLPQRFYP